MKLKLAQLLLNMLDNFLSITISGRGNLLPTFIAESILP
jgi:hypothetical protein